jgi:hypothetical protein
LHDVFPIHDKGELSFPEVGISSGNQALTRCAFLGANPGGITSYLPMIHPESFFALSQTYRGQRYGQLGWL